MTPGQQVTLEIVTTSQDMQTPPQSGTPPKITMNGNPVPDPKGGGPYYATGLRLLVLDPSMDITNPTSIRSNQYIGVSPQDGSWMTSYHWAWAGVVRQILTSGDPDQQLVIMATYGFDANMPPDSAALQILMGLGAGPQLQTWETTVDVGSQSGSWVGYPANYVLVGNSSYGYGQGTELFQRATGSSVETTVQATLTNAA